MRSRSAPTSSYLRSRATPITLFAGKTLPRTASTSDNRPLRIIEVLSDRVEGTTTSCAGCCRSCRRLFPGHGRSQRRTRSSARGWRERPSPSPHRSSKVPPHPPHPPRKRPAGDRACGRPVGELLELFLVVDRSGLRRLWLGSGGRLARRQRRLLGAGSDLGLELGEFVVYAALSAELIELPVHVVLWGAERG
jgi:hypothetical protein